MRVLACARNGTVWPEPHQKIINSSLPHLPVTNMCLVMGNGGGGTFLFLIYLSVTLPPSPETPPSWEESDQVELCHVEYV